MASGWDDVRELVKKLERCTKLSKIWAKSSRVYGPLKSRFIHRFHYGLFKFIASFNLQRFLR
jgi:hypothetical protein